MAKAGSTKIGKAEVRVDYDVPTDPSEVQVLWQLPYNARVTSVVVHYVQIPYDEVLAERKRHDAAVKANATRKAKKKAVQP